MKKVSRIFSAIVVALALTGASAMAENVNENKEWVMVYHSLTSQDTLVAEVVDRDTGDILKTETFLVGVSDGRIFITPSATVGEDVSDVEAGESTGSESSDPVLPAADSDNAGPVSTGDSGDNGVVDVGILEGKEKLDAAEETLGGGNDGDFAKWVETTLSDIHDKLLSAKAKLGEILSTKIVVDTPIDTGTPSAAADDAPAIEPQAPASADVPTESAEPIPVK